jgi:ubiquinone/menaquinone biosynthesis methyltransferase
MERVYAGSTVRELFDTMSDSYERVNCVLSGGLTVWWRRRLVTQLARRAAPSGARVHDLLTGQGELWPSVRRAFPASPIVGLDFSEGMLAGARRRIHRSGLTDVVILHEDALANSIPDASAQLVVCAFGLKTFSEEDRERFAAEVVRILAPGGACAFIEASYPTHPLLRLVFAIHVERVVPFVGGLVARARDEYATLAPYTKRFGDARAFTASLAARGLDVTPLRWMGGFATGVIGSRAAA